MRSAGLALGYDVAAALHNEQLLQTLRDSPEGVARNVSLAALAANPDPPPRHPLAVHGALAPPAPSHGSSGRRSSRWDSETAAPPWPAWQATAGSAPDDSAGGLGENRTAAEEAVAAGAPFVSLSGSVRAAAALAGRACNSATGECACVAPLIETASPLWSLITAEGNVSAGVGVGEVELTVWAACKCGWTGAYSYS